MRNTKSKRRSGRRQSKGNKEDYALNYGKSTNKTKVNEKLEQNKGNTGSTFQEKTEDIDTSERTITTEIIDTSGRPVSDTFRKYNVRKRTFKKWNKDDSDVSDSLAEAGFIYKAKTDQIKCFACDVRLTVQDDLLAPSTDFWLLHAQFSSSCQFVAQVKGLEYVSRIQEEKKKTEELQQALESNSVAIEAARTIYDDIEEGVLRRAVRILIDKGKSKFKGIELAKTILELKSQIPIENTDKSIPETTNETSIEIQKKDETVHHKGISAENQNNDSTDEPLHDETEINLDVESLQEENNRMKEQMTCKICFDDPACMIWIPCGHMSTCQKCVETLKLCPICRVTKRKVVKAVLTAMDGINSRST